MGFKGGSEERHERRMEEKKEFLKEVFSKLEENMNTPLEPELAVDENRKPLTI